MRHGKENVTAQEAEVCVAVVYGRQARRPSRSCTPPPQGESKGGCICKGKATAPWSGSWRGWHKQWQPSRSQCDSVRPLKEMEGGGGDFRQANLLSHTETSVSPVRPSCPTQQHPGAADTPRRVAREAQLRHDRPLLRRHNIQRHGMPE